jgi:membrane protein implicated in regulation of membrane protease activity
VGSFFLPLPWPVQLALCAAGTGVAILYLRRFVVFARRL